jgi:DNA-binding PadR family transcriptional regulator
MAVQHSDESRAWGVLFALSLREDRTIFGRVNLNKTLALLQRDGFPIKNRFENRDMGPYDWHIHADAESLEKEKLLDIEEKPTRYDRPVDVYRLNEEGLKLVQRKYPARIETLPYRSIFKAKIDEIRRTFATYKTPEIVERVHHELLMDMSQEDSEREIAALLSRLSETADESERRRDPSCSVCLDLLGCLDFAITSLSLAVKKTSGTNESSRNLIYFNAKETLHWATKLVRHDHVRFCRAGEGPQPKLREQLGYRLYCTEELCALYEIVKPIRDELSLKEYIQTVSV